MKNIHILCTVIIAAALSYAQDEQNLIGFDVGGLVSIGTISAHYQRRIAGKHCIGLAGRTNTEYFKELKSYSGYIGYNYYSKKPFKGLWVLAYTGAEKRTGGNLSIPILPGLGYRWELPAHLTIGIGVALGIEVSVYPEFGEMRFAYYTPIDFGFTF